MKPLVLFAGWILWLVCTVPAPLRASVANPEIPDSLKRGACSVVRDYSVEFVQKSATGGEAQFRKTVTVLNAEGLEGATFIHVDGHFSKLKKFKGGISNSQGKQVVKLRRSDLKESTLSSGLTSDSHTYYYECPPYSYPFSVTYEWTCDYSNGMLVYPDFYPQISYNQSVQNASYRLSVPGNVDVIYRSNRIGKAPEVIRHDEYTTYAWTGISLTASHPAYNGDARSVVGYIESEPTVFECDGYEGRQDTWQKFGVWKNKLLQGRDNLPDGEKQKIIAMTRDAASPVEKIRILYDYLARNTRYVSIQLGIGGWQPIDAATVSRTKFGDCKGLTNYMKAMLAVAGIPSVYTCISVEEKRFCPHLPGVHQLDHAILCVPLPADTLWLECTNAYLPFGYVHSDIAGHDAMLVDDNGGRLVRLPDYPDSCHRQSFHTRMQLDAQGNMTGVMTHRNAMRYYEKTLPLLSMNEKQRVRELGGMLQGNPPRISSVHVTERKDSVPQLTCRFAVMGQCGTVNGNRMFLTVNPYRRRPSVSPVASHAYPLYLTEGSLLTDTLEVLLPAGYVPERIPKPVSLSQPFGTFVSNVTVRDGRLFVCQSMLVRKGTYPREMHVLWNEFLNQAGKADREMIVLVRKESES